MDTTRIAAWWGAFVATLVLAWDIYKWKRSGARVKVRGAADVPLRVGGVVVVEPDGSPRDAAPLWVGIEAINVGSRPTTITAVAATFYGSILRLPLRRPLWYAQNIEPRVVAKLPRLLAPGDMLTAYLSQDALKDLCREKGRLYCGVEHTMSRRGSFARVRLR